MQVEHTENILPKRVLPPHAPPPHQSPAFLHMHCPSHSRRAKQKKKTQNHNQLMVKRPETKILCVPIQIAHSTGTEKKHWATWGQKASRAPGAGFHAHTWSPEHENQHLCMGSNFTAALPLPPTQTALREAHKASSFFHSPKGGEERGPHLPVAIIISFCAWSDSPTWGYLQAWRTKQRWHSLPSLCVFLCLPAWCC